MTLTTDPAEARESGTLPNGQQEKYVVLSDQERTRGFVRPVRTSYRHATCGTVTHMHIAIAETYARDPGFYGGTFCSGCGAHFPVGEFHWRDDGEVVGS